MNVSASHSPITDLVKWNTPATTTADPATTLQAAQQEQTQSPADILSSLAPTNTSLYGAASQVDSLLGNISTSAGLTALAQVNAGRSASTQITPLTDAATAVDYGTSALESSTSALLASDFGNLSASLALPAAYYSRSYSLPTTVSQVSISA